MPCCVDRKIANPKEIHKTRLVCASALGMMQPKCVSALLVMVEDPLANPLLGAWFCKDDFLQGRVWHQSVHGEESLKWSQTLGFPVVGWLLCMGQPCDCMALGTL